MREAVIVEAVRTPVGKRNGVLRHWHPVELAASVLDEVVKRAGLDKGKVEDIVMGCVTPIAEQGLNIGRLAALRAGFPVHVPAVQINRMCGSGQQALHFAAQAIQAGAMDIAMAAGVESMSRVPIGSDGNEQTIPEALKQQFSFIHQGVAAERIAKKYGITREECDQYAYQSHQRAIKATKAGHFTAELMRLTGHDREGHVVNVVQDEGMRPDTSLEKLAQLKPVFVPDGLITAGNSSQMSDGAAAILLAEAKTARQLGLRVRARIIAQMVVGSDPTLMLDGVIPVTEKILHKTGLSLEQIDRIEINEAFAPVVLAWQKQVGADLAKVNVNGGAIALGHPLGATGIKLMTTLVGELERIQGRYGLMVICIGHGMATATLVERSENHEE